MPVYQGNRPAPRQQRTNAPAVQEKGNAITQLKNAMAQENIKIRFREVLGEKTNQFMASIANAVDRNSLLQECSTNSVLGAAFVAATYDLPIDSNLGFAAIVPYKNGKTGVVDAQFQLMKKGFIQLAIRSGQYEDMNVSAVYRDELKSYNPITGECEFVDDFTQTSDRQSGDPGRIVGYYAWFRLRTGFRKGLYMSTEDLKTHGIKYSQSYRKDLNSGDRKSLWSTNFQAMAEKTVIKRLLSHWGILSIQTLSIQEAINADQLVWQDMDNASYADNEYPADEAIQARKAPEEIGVRNGFEPAEQNAAQGRTGRDMGNQPQPYAVQQGQSYMPPQGQPQPAQPPQPVQRGQPDFSGFEQAEMQFDPGDLPFR